MRPPGEPALTSALVVLRADLRRRWRAWLLLGVMVGVAAGVIFAALAGARRTATAFDRYAAWADVADLTGTIKNRAAGEALARMPGVADVAHLGVLDPFFGVFGERLAPFPTEVTVGVTDGRYFKEVERPRLVEGRFWKRGAAEAVVTPAFVARTGLDVGDRLEVVAFSHDVIERFGPDNLPAAFELDRSIGRVTEVSIVGRVVRAVDVVRDSASAPGYFVVDRRSAATILGTSIEGLAPVFDHGHGITVVLEPGVDARSVVSAAGLDDVTALDQVRADVAVAVRPYVVALLLFAALGALGAIAAIGGAVARQAVADAADVPSLVSLGASSRLLTALAAGRAAIVGAVGGMIATAVAIALSPLFPIGPVAEIDPDPGVAVDLIVLVPGSLLVLAAVVTVGALAGRHRRASRSYRAAPGWLSLRLARLLPPTGAVGVRMALPAPGRARWLMRLTIVPVAVAILGGAAVAVFAISLGDLFEHPQRYGWNWDVAVTCKQGYCDTSSTFVDDVVVADEVDAWTLLSFDRLDVEGHEVPAVGAGLGHGDLDPWTILEGRPPISAEEIVLGGSTMRDLGARIGNEVTLDGLGRSFRIVGRAVFTGLGFADLARPSLGRGAGMTADAMVSLKDASDTPEAVVLTVDGDPGPFTEQLRERLGPYATVLPTQRPSALAAWPKLRQLPLLLGALVAVLGLGSLAHGVAASTRLHRRDLALVRALGMASVQIGYAVLWQTVTIFALAVAIGAPLGTAIGITAWQALAGELDLSSPAVIAPAPLAAAAVVAAAAVTALAMVSVRAAARKPAAVTLHAD